MRVILLDNVEGLGKRGEMQDVRDGFGRNFLIPPSRQHREISRNWKNGRRLLSREMNGM
jgi:ribosomal protein L9